MVGVIIVGPRRQDEVGFPLPDLANDLLSRVQARQQLAVVIVEDDVLDPDAASRFPRFRAPPGGQRAASLRLVSRVAVGDGDEPHPVAERGVLGGDAARSLITVVRMGAKRDDVQLAICAGRLRPLGRRLLRPGHGPDRRAGAR